MTTTAPVPTPPAAKAPETPEVPETPAAPEISDFERGVIAGIEAFEQYFRDDNSALTIGEARETIDNHRGWAWIRLGESDLKGYRQSATTDALRDEAAK